MSTKTNNIIFWVTTTLIFLLEGVMPALTSNSELAKEGILHLGYPDYFRNLLTVYKVTGTLALIIPQIPSRIKEWAYAGLGFTFISAAVSHCVVDGFNGQTIFPLIGLLILTTSYITYTKKSAVA